MGPVATAPAATTGLATTGAATTPGATTRQTAATTAAPAPAVPASPDTAAPEPMADRRPDRDPTRPVYVISVAAGIVSVHPRTLRIYEDEGLIAPARTPTNIRLYSENDIRRVLWIRHLTQERGVNLAGVRILFELEERLGTRILEVLFDEGTRNAREASESNDQPKPSRSAGRRSCQP